MLRNLNSILAIAFLAMAFVFSGPTAQACEVQEMQFFGIVRNVQQNSAILGGTICSYQVELVADPMEPRPSYICPLVPGEASMLTFVDLTCTKKDGDKINGVMVKKGDESWIE